ncbi:Bcr/CflA family multidrug efflux MFS transporter [Enhydrobacter sp.]|jgi:DHA1 family bicyclomycin/chloramphenicol resistance-like MFS transporter|uniref:Bcr/CflA family multidrug efflux MFS transporter n=1 Tax=Enhydrobacter sp. TaxID=1894999 RepID=UPI00261FBC07|nr:Bcr/CflA family multidrug efflux MFS transporter [Enhydrobacter sp.]
MTALSDSSAAETRPALTPVLLAVLALLSAFTPLSIDMYLPALPVIESDLKASVGDIQLTLSAFMIAFGVGQIFYGPAGDRFGRRPVILGGLAVYVLASIGCAFAAAADQLVLLRLLQGLAACGGVVLARTMVRDLAERDQAARAMSLMMACTSIAPMLAPLLGGQILWFLGWRAIFFILAGIGLFAWTAAFTRLPETLRPEYRQPLVVSAILKRFGELLRHKAFMGYALTSSLQFAALFSFLSGSPFVFIQHYGIPPRLFGLLFGGMVVFMTVGSLLNAKFAPVFGAGKILRYAVIVPAIVGPAALILGLVEARSGAIGMWPFFLCLVPQIAVISLIGPNGTAMALQRYPHMAGTASSLMGIMQFGLGAIFGAIVGQTFDGTIAPMTTAMGIAGALCLVAHRWLVGRD